MNPFMNPFLQWAMTASFSFVIAACLVGLILALFVALEVKLAQAFGLKEAIINGATNVFIVVSVVAATWIAVGYP